MEGWAVAHRILVTKAALQANTHADWNAFIELLANTEFEDLAPSQRPAALVFRYESEVQNGGHLQYLVNVGRDRAKETVQSLYAIGAGAQARILERVLARWMATARLPPIDALEYVAIEDEGEFSDLDRDFHACAVTLVDLLRRHFADHEDWFVVRD
jgi:hypothetical protein